MHSNLVINVCYSHIHACMHAQYCSQRIITQVFSLSETNREMANPIKKPLTTKHQKP
jgi:hypothetical protein